MRAINDARDEPLVLKYFQYLLLFIEYYLDQYFNNRQNLVDGLNDYVTFLPGNFLMMHAAHTLKAI